MIPNKNHNRLELTTNHREENVANHRAVMESVVQKLVTTGCPARAGLQTLAKTWVDAHYHSHQWRCNVPFAGVGLTCRTRERLIGRSRGRLANRWMQVSRRITALVGSREPVLHEREFDVERSPEAPWEG
jgi:hypothetical protein